MTRKNIRDYVLWKLGLVESDWPITEMIVVANSKLGEICEAITQARQGYFGVYSTFSLAASVGDAARREYSLPNDILNNLYMLELNLDGTGFVPVKRTHLIPGKDFRLDEAWITGNYNNSNPEYAVFRNSLFILSGEIKPIVNGGRLWYINYPDPLPDLTDNVTDMSVATDAAASVPVGFPLQFHELLARAIIISYKEKHTLPLVGREPLFDSDLQEKIKRLSEQDLSEVVVGKVPNQGDGSQY